MFGPIHFIAGTLCAALFIQAVRADLGKGTLFPEGLHDPLIAYDTIKTAPIRETRGSAVPQICKNYGGGKAWGMDGDISCDVDNMEAREIFYEDCEQSWTLCRCPDANMSLDQMQERFGQVPVGIRSYVGAALATSAGGCSAVCFEGSFIRFHGDCPMTVFLHEAGHAFDQGFSGSAEFKDAIAKDTCVPDYYANSNEVEDWTQVNVLYTYTKQFGPLPKNTTCLQHQFDALVNDVRVNEAQDTKTCLVDKRPHRTILQGISSTETGAEPETETLTSTSTSRTETPVATEAPAETKSPLRTTTSLESEPSPTNPASSCRPRVKLPFYNMAKRLLRFVKLCEKHRRQATIATLYSSH